MIKKINFIKIFLLLFLCFFIFAKEFKWEKINNKAIKSFDKGNVKKGIKFKEKALKLIRNELKLTDPKFIKFLSGYGVILQQNQIYDRAEDIYLEVVRILKNIYPPYHDQRIESLFNLGSLYFYIGDSKKIKILYDNAYREIEASLSNDLVKLSDFAVSFGDILLSNYMNHESEIYYLEALDIKEKLYGSKSKELYQILRKLKKLYIMSGQDKKRYDIENKLNSLE